MWGWKEWYIQEYRAQNWQREDKVLKSADRNGKNVVSLNDALWIPKCADYPERTWSMWTETSCVCYLGWIIAAKSVSLLLSLPYGLIQWKSVLHVILFLCNTCNHVKTNFSINPFNYEEIHFNIHLHARVYCIGVQKEPEKLNIVLLIKCNKPCNWHHIASNKGVSMYRYWS